MRASQWVGIAFAAGLGLAGCAQHTVGFVPVGALAVRVTPDQEADVVWLLRDEAKGGEVRETVMRCHNTESGPVCVTAKESAQ